MGIKAVFDGTIGKDPELKGEGDKAYTFFGVATSRFVGEGRGDERDGKPSAYKTTWVNVIAYGKSAESIVKRFRKGHVIVVNSAEFIIDTFEKKDTDGNVIDQNSMRVSAKLLDFSGPYTRAASDNGGSSSQSNSGSQQRQSAAPRQAAASNSGKVAAKPQTAAAAQDDDIPF